MTDPADPPSLKSSIINNASNYGAQGIFNGPVSINAALPLPSPEEARALLDRLPLDHVPEPQNLPTPHRMTLRPNPLFVGREDELRTLARMLHKGGTVAITTGIGGMGKTQLAVELAHRYGAYFAGGVFWVSCADPANIPGEIAACGLRGLVTRADYAELKQDDQVELVRAAWAEPIPRLLIFDNCEEEQVLRQWLPATGGARVLVTSRRASWSVTLKVQPVPLEVLGRPASVTLLQQLASRLSSEEAEQIAEALGDLPLALHLAGHYLARYSIPVADYLTRLASAQLQHPSLQGRGVEDMPTDREPHVEKVFALSFARLDVSNLVDALARQLLARAACFAPGESFQREWLEATATIEGDDQAKTLACTDAVKRLLDLGLLEQTNSQTLRLHRLLANYAAYALTDDGALGAVEAVLGNEVSKVNRHGLPAMMQLVLPHLRYALQQALGREDARIAQFHSHLGYYLYAVGAYQEALFHAKRASTLREHVLGVNHPDTAQSLNDLAALYRTLGKYDYAQPLHERALAIREQVLGPNHPDTAQSLNNLAVLYRTLGKYDYAQLLYERALAIREQVLGTEHPDTAQSLNNLAVLYRNLGIYQRAQQLYEQALAIRERTLGAEHLDTAQSLNDLAALYWVQKDYNHAQPLFERALAVRKQILGIDHPNTAQSMNNLAMLYKALGKYEYAQRLLEQVLVVQEQMLGVIHPDTAQSLNNLAVLYYEQGAYEQAQPLFERVLAIREHLLGNDHPDKALSLNNLANLYSIQGKYYQALPLYKHALSIYQNIFGNEHSYTRITRDNLRKCNTSIHIDTRSPEDTSQFIQILAQARIMVDTALTDSTVNRETLTTTIEDLAQWAECDEAEGSSYFLLAAELRALIPLLGVESGDPDALD